MRIYPDTDEEDLVRNAVNQAAEFLSSSPLSASRLSTSPFKCKYAVHHWGNWPCEYCDYANLSRESTQSPSRMSTNPSPSAKGSSKASESKYDIETVLPLLLAVLGNPSPNYKQMALMDENKRTEAAWQHRFRAWKAKGREIAAAHPDITIASAAASPVKKRAPAAKKDTNGKGKAKQADVGDEEDEVDEDTGAVAVKQEEAEDMAGVDNEMPPPATHGKAKSVKANANGVNGTKKRAASKNRDAETEEGESPAKKAKITKKGTAKVVKKPAAKPRESASGDEEESEAKPNGKGRAKAVPKGKGKGANIEEEKPPVKKWKAEVLAEAGKIALKEDQKRLMEEVDSEDEDQTEMEFVEEA